ncbi:MAG: hypothetical protein ACOCP9_03130 [Halofilum sp. (in: g-proteobacteria)]
MKERQKQVHGSRRAFFRSVAGLGVAAGSGALILRYGPDAQAQASGAEAPKDNKTYVETDHIRKYYETARG